MQILYSNAACGSAKSTSANTMMASEPARYVLSVTRLDEIEARGSALTREAAQHGHFPIIRYLTSQTTTSVARDFGPMMEAHAEADHVIIIVTHAALKLVDHGHAEGWTLIVDEDPKLWQTATFDLDASLPFWESTYTLSPTTLAGYSEIGLRADAPSRQRLANDEFVRVLAPFHNRVRTGGVIVRLTDWPELEAKKRLTWFAIWDVRALAAYDRVIILANAFDSLLTFKLIRDRWPQIDMKPIQMSVKREWKPRDLHINYVAADHRASTKFFKSEAGQQAVKSWCEFVTKTVHSDRHYWAANKSLNLTLPGKRVTTKIAGSNEYRDLTECSVLYAAKASPLESKVFADLTQGAITSDDVQRDREFEDLIQIVFRSSLRQPEDDRTVVINVYDRQQAEFLGDYFAHAGFGFRTTLNHHDLNIVRPPARPAGRPRLGSQPLTAAERKRRSRARKAVA